ncbi:MAG: anti-sigma factor family protein [Streptosporangiaceae bacterium]
MTCLMMTSLGVYVLGAAGHDERRKVEAHLPHCHACRAELMRLAPIPGLLAMVPPAAAPRPRSGEVARPANSQPAVARPDRMARVKPGGRRRSGRLIGSLAALAASAAFAAVLITGILGTSSPARRGGHAAAPVTLSGTNRASHVHAKVTLLATSWGTRIRLTVRGVPINVRCRLVVRSTVGGTETTGLWEAWREGPITVPASAAWRPSDISSLAVMAGARTLVTIKPARPGSAGQRSSSVP